VLDKSMIERNK